MNPFVSQEAALTLDRVGRAYGTRPSSIMGINPVDGRSILFDLKVMEQAALFAAELKTLSGQIKQSRQRWPSEIKEELQEMGLW